MTLVSNDPSLWPLISSSLFFSYWSVAAGVVVVYDWVLTLGQEVGRFYYCQSSQLAKNGIIDRTNLEATLVPHDCVVSHCALC
ncbi:hypothetical protein EV702DRAFT_1089008 [Suillus placidus]|uniref:Uncharacterized protein n=1 Tax=Suillus placidus TaxID=48579 RepID=A0A9P7D563_9AGAM|nr:hypothetical protein EV702DRAFT_1089008 [Suillus placidus]